MTLDSCRNTSRQGTRRFSCLAPPRLGLYGPGRRILPLYTPCDALHGSVRPVDAGLALSSLPPLRVFLFVARLVLLPARAYSCIEFASRMMLPCPFVILH